ncbi:MAG TPA: HEAT repeat domain-containing protein [Allosphingosinicella sp.]|jgi:hypothetical protein
MITSEALADWLGNGTARSATAAAMERLAGRFAAMPAFAALDRALEPASSAGAEAVLALARTFIEDDSTIGLIVSEAVAAAASDPLCRPPLRASSNEVQDGLVLFSRPTLVIQLAVISAEALAIKRRFREGPASIVFTGQRSLFRFLKGGGALLSLWEAPLIDSGFSAEDCGPCRLFERRRLADGDWLEVDGRSESFVVDRAASDLVYVFASTSLEASPVAAEYDGRSLELVAASSTDDSSSRIQMMLALLRTLDRRDAAPLFEERLKAPHFHARWQAMRELLALDPGVAVPHLREMAALDPHPEIRAAACATLAQFFPEPSEGKEASEPCLA